MSAPRKAVDPGLLVAGQGEGVARHDAAERVARGRLGAGPAGDPGLVLVDEARLLAVLGDGGVEQPLFLGRARRELRLGDLVGRPRRALGARLDGLDRVSLGLFDGVGVACVLLPSGGRTSLSAHDHAAADDAA
jgi:hypothetical protein